MGLFTKKREVKLEDFCRDFYETQILNSKIGGMNVDPNALLAEVIKKYLVEIDNVFVDIDLQKLTYEFTVMRFELFALAWTHKFISGDNVVAQSAFTKRYLHEKDRDDIWDSMKPYNIIINGGTLQWLSNLGKFNLSFNYNMREDLAQKNTEVAKKNSIATNDSIERVNKRTWSENAWRQKLLLGPLAVTLWNQLGLNPDKLTEEAEFQLQVAIKGLYDGAQQSWDNIKIKG